MIRSSITDCQCQTFKSFLSLDCRVPYSSAVARYVLHSFASLTQYLMRDLARPCVYINASVANAFGTIKAASVGGLKGWMAQNARRDSQSRAQPSNHAQSRRKLKPEIRACPHRFKNLERCPPGPVVRWGGRRQGAGMDTNCAKASARFTPPRRRTKLFHRGRVSGPSGRLG